MSRAIEISFSQIEERLPTYLESYDIVLIEDGTMAIPRKILDAIMNQWKQLCSSAIIKVTHSSLLAGARLISF